jgi:hypothetical protein
MITGAPVTVAVCPAATATFSIVASGNGPFAYRWSRGSTPIDVNANPSAATADLTLTSVQNADSAAYKCIVTNACGSTASPAAQLLIDPADVGSAGGLPGSDGLHDNNDFIVYIDTFFNQSPAADLGSTGGVLGADGQFDNNDFVVFIDQFFAAC